VRLSRAVGFVLFLFSVSGIVLLSNCDKSPPDIPAVDKPPGEIHKEVVDSDQERFVVDDETKTRIDKWIEENNFNRYGDPKGTVYAGGTPLFDMKTGKTFDRYQYILDKHPELRAPKQN
jgi:hypothetical protein